MDMITIINESKKRTNLMNSIGIEWQYATQLLPKVLNETKDITPEFKEMTNTLYKLLDNMEEEIRELKTFIPSIDN